MQFETAGLKDNRGGLYAPGVNCSKCGRWVGKDGDCDFHCDYESVVWEVEFPLCGPCLRKENNE